jgi:hypothetical protein
VSTLENETIKSHLRTLYTGQETLLVWLRDVADSLEDVVGSVRSSGVPLPPALRTKLDVLASALGRAQVSDLALQAIQGQINDLKTTL